MIIKEKKMNDVYLSGNLGADPEFPSMASGKKYSKFTLAVNRGYKDAQGNWQNKTSWFNISCFLEYRQEKISHLRKGDPVIIHGRIEQSTFQGNDGRSHSSISIIADSVEKLVREPHGQQQAAPASAGRPQGYGSQGMQPQQAQPSGGWNGTGPSAQPQNGGWDNGGGW